MITQKKQISKRATNQNGLTDPEQIFADAYLKNGMNGTRAYMAAHPNASWGTANMMAGSYLAKPLIKAYLSAGMAEMALGRDEALSRLAAMARADIDGLIDDAGRVDLHKARELGQTGVIKKIKIKTKRLEFEDAEAAVIEDIDIELYDAQAALEKILRVHGAFDDRLRVDGRVETIVVTADANVDAIAAKLLEFEK